MDHPAQLVQDFRKYAGPLAPEAVSRLQCTRGEALLWWELVKNDLSPAPPWWWRVPQSAPDSSLPDDPERLAVLQSILYRFVTQPLAGTKVLSHSIKEVIDESWPLRDGSTYSVEGDSYSRIVVNRDNYFPTSEVWSAVYGDTALMPENFGILICDMLQDNLSEGIGHGHIRISREEKEHLSGLCDQLAHLSVDWYKYDQDGEVEELSAGPIDVRWRFEHIPREENVRFEAFTAWGVLHVRLVMELGVTYEVIPPWDRRYLKIAGSRVEASPQIRAFDQVISRMLRGSGLWALTVANSQFSAAIRVLTQIEVTSADGLSDYSAGEYTTRQSQSPTLQHFDLESSFWEHLPVVAKSLDVSMEVVHQAVQKGPQGVDWGYMRSLAEETMARVLPGILAQLGGRPAILTGLQVLSQFDLRGAYQKLVEQASRGNASTILVLPIPVGMTAPMIYAPEKELRSGSGTSLPVILLTGRVSAIPDQWISSYK